MDSRLKEMTAVLKKYKLTHGLTPEKFRLILQELGPTYIKLGQIMSLHSDILPKEYCEELMKLCSDVEPMPFEQVEAVIDASFGYSWKDDVFASIDKKPLGAASIAQVHRATLKTGEQVVLKVQRKGIHEVMSKDMALLHKAVKLVPPISIKGIVDFDMVLDEMWAVAQEEMNFLLEASNIEEFAGNNRDVAVELVLDMDIKSYEECSRNAMWDMYIPGFDVDIKQETQQLKKLIIRKNNKCRVSGNVKVEDYINLMQIVNATANVQIDSYECIPEGIEIMGAVIVNIFYITSDDNSPMGSINSVIPFTTVVELKEYNKNLIEYTIRPSIEQLQASMNSSAQIEVKAVIALDTICFEPFNINVIDECECNKRENVDYSALPSMVGYISDGKCTVWDIAKKYDTTGDLMREENSTIQRLVDSDIIPAGTKLLLVRKAMV